MLPKSVESSTSVGLPEGGVIPSLDGLRAVSILIVVWAHASLPGHIAGSMGVSIFFFLSGYLITTLMRMEGDSRGRISIRDFYLRRLFRIFPPLYIILAIAIVLSLTGLTNNTVSVGGTISAATFFSNYWIILHDGAGLPGGMNLLWSLAVEEHFYLIFPILYIAMRRWMPRRNQQVIVLVTICLLILIWRCYLATTGADPIRLYYATDTRADALLWGAVLAIGFNPVYGEVRAFKTSWLAIAVPVACAIVFFASSRTPQLIHYSIGFSIQSIALFGVFVPLITRSQSVLGKLLNLRWIVFIGILSYTLYLDHNMLLDMFQTLIANPIYVVVIALASATALSIGLHAAVEKPFAKLRRRISHAGERE